MKTPREVLLAQHQAATPKLDAIRRAALKELNHEESKAKRWPFSIVALLLHGSKRCWCELIWPCRRTWAGLAAVWVVILAVNFAARDPLPVREAHNATPVSRNMFLALKEQKRLLAELTSPAPLRPVEKPKRTAPQPHSQRREDYLSV